MKRKYSSLLFITLCFDYVYQDPHIDNASFELHFSDPIDSSNLTRILQEVLIDEVLKCVMGRSSFNQGDYNWCINA
jgi:GDPmannose 4,6-dehydratase